MYLPHTDNERKEMLAAIGVDSLEKLFTAVPSKYRFPELNLPPGVTEMEAYELLSDLASANENTQDLICFLGAGAYNHYVPAVLSTLLRRGEFLTAYTPYQPEISQGTLQAIYDYQSLITALTGMDVSNASHYDGATSAAEAVSMADAHYRGKRKKVVLSPALHPMFRETIRSYHVGTGIEFVGDDPAGDLLQSPNHLASYIDENTALVYVQYPDFFGRIFDFSALAQQAHAAGALFAVSVNPISLGLLKPPSEFDADIVTGEGQPLGIPLSFGGPYLGIFTTKKEYVRKMAGRLVGETVDNRGQRAYVLTLTAREQHIRREKATSNICTNQGIMALSAAIYLALLGKQGLRQVAELCYHKAHYAADQISKVKGFKLWSVDPFFNEFVVQTPLPVPEINEHLLEHGIIGGYDLQQDYTQLSNHMLVAVTEMNSKDEIDYLANILQEVSHG